MSLRWEMRTARGHAWLRNQRDVLDAEASRRGCTPGVLFNAGLWNTSAQQYVQMFEEAKQTSNAELPSAATAMRGQAGEIN
jgi:hypothetical protein